MRIDQGLTHIASSLGSEQFVDELTQRLENDGFTILDGPRRTVQFHEAEDLKRRVGAAGSFDDVAEVLQFAATDKPGGGGRLR